ncbi:hypothetical protein BSZ35_18045 [Salinibacter sp. 10B]|uniref:hypothetical protein n=1 Tax=Salinibacter sp. 10B TaxID=1923971 RepID=UPI000CF56BB1|nr:hypothetical protein [Salinibacter sp. 10B]PQJ26833.1 hypothetical protein BSZ35_18045 [Salinibacter sp. 10B]
MDKLTTTTAGDLSSENRKDKGEKLHPTLSSSPPIPNLDLSPEEIIQAILKEGARATLSNQWRLARRRVQRESRIELLGPNGPEVLACLTEHRDVVDLDWQ